MRVCLFLAVIYVQVVAVKGHSIYRGRKLSLNTCTYNIYY